MQRKAKCREQRAESREQRAECALTECEVRVQRALRCLVLRGVGRAFRSTVRLPPQTDGMSFQKGTKMMAKIDRMLAADDLPVRMRRAAPSTT